MTNFHISLGSEVADALRDGRPVVALESTIVSHGLPRPDNLRVAREIEQAVRDAGAVPATIGMVAGELRVGLDDAQLTRLATVDGVSKLSVRDLAPA
ncbi:pseudouridine-5-phosphate glycosidase, partial [Micromonospora chalcea]